MSRGPAVVPRVRDFGEVLKLGEKRIDMIAVSKACGDVVTATARSVKLYLQRFFDEKVDLDGYHMPSLEVKSSGPSKHGDVITRHRAKEVRHVLRFQSLPAAACDFHS